MSRVIDVSNELGYQERAMKSKVLAVAMQKPENYYALRDEVLSKVRDTIVEKVYKIFSELLTLGIVEGVQIAGKDAGDKELKLIPALPFADVQAFALDCAVAIEDKCELAIEYILPMDFKTLADKRSNTLLKAKTGL